MARLPDDLEQVGTPAQPLVVAERRAEPDALAAEVPADQVGRERKLLAKRDRRRLRKHRFGVRAECAVPDVAEHHVAVGVLLDVEEGRAGERLDRVQSVQQRAPAEEERAGRFELLVQPGEEGDTAPGRRRVERAAVLRHLRAEEARKSFPHRGRLGVVADEEARHVS